MKCFPSTLIFMLIFLAGAMIIPSSSAIEHSRGYGDICFHCHDTILNEEEKNSKLGRCSCHSLHVDNFMASKEDKSKLSSIHEHLCVKCHAGLPYSQNDFGRMVHLPHASLECSTCHGDGNITTPAAENCFNCHVQDVHDVHQAVIGEICVGCHGKSINGFPGLKEEKGIVLETPEAEPKGFSLYDLLKFLFPLVFDHNT